MKKLIISSVMLFLTAIFFSCGDDSSEVNESDAVDKSVVTMPSSLKKTSTPSKGSSEDNSGGIIGVYNGVPIYVKMADDISTMCKEIMVNIMSSGITEKLNRGEVLVIKSINPEDPKRVLLEDSDDSRYENKLSLYYTAAGSSPEMIVRYTIIDDLAKGRLLFTKVMPDDKIASVEKTVAVDVVFDGTTATKTLEIKFTQDITNLIAYAKANSTNKTIDLGQPSKVFLNATYNENTKIYKIFGSSYHPGWGEMSDLSYENVLPWDIKTRQIYLFKATATEDNAKVYIAFPYNTDTSVANVWENHSFSKVVVPAFKNKFRTKHLTSAGISAGDMNNFQNNITYVYSTMMNLSTPTFVTEGSVKFLSEDSFNKMYDWMLNNPSPNADMQNFKNMFGSLKAMVNPAMFTKVSAGKAQMLGTYDTDLAKYYKYDAGLLTATDISSEAKKIYDYDTSDDKQLYIPFDVVGAVIKVE